MKTWTIAALILSAACVALGVYLSGGSTGWAGPVGASLVILGGAMAAVCIALWAARALLLVRERPGRARDSARIDALIGDLGACAHKAATQGILTLTQHRTPERSALFAAAVEMLVNADLPETIRRAMTEKAERESAAQHARRANLVLACRVVPIVAVGMALAAMLWMLVALAGGRAIADLGTLTPLALIVCVYGAFAIAAIAAEVGDRYAASALEDELAGALVIETIVAIRSGESPDRVAALLRGLTPPGTADAPALPLRQAA